MKKTAFFVLANFILWSATAQADMSQIKAYKEAFPDTLPKCINCHVDALPKKDGSHDPNDYGKAVIKAAGAEKPTADIYKKIGTIEDFAKIAPTGTK
ncbi:MAG: hypothetical protein HQL12_08750 [Candidatus Omnitrophica bacterium]|nr:hypothetical protein [Candidatus Omnitrophota bacterium]